MVEYDLGLPATRREMEMKPLHLSSTHQSWHCSFDNVIRILVIDWSVVYVSLISSSHPSCGGQPLSLLLYDRHLQSTAKSLYYPAGKQSSNNFQLHPGSPELTMKLVCQVIRFYSFYQTCLIVWVITILQCGSFLYYSEFKPVVVQLWGCCSVYGAIHMWRAAHTGHKKLTT